MNAINRDAWDTKDIITYNNWLQGKTLESDYKFTVLASVDPHSTYDAVQLKFDADGYSELHFIELKGRQIEIDKYTDCIVDKFKIDSLIRLTVSTCRPVYLVAIYYPSSKLAIWRLDAEEEYEVQNKLCPFHTANNDGEMIEKEMVLLPLNKAKIYRFNN